MRTLVLEPLEDRVVPASLPANFVESLVGSGIASATALEFAPDGELWALEQTGRVLRFRQDSTVPDVVGNLASLGLDTSGERGLLGIAFDPQYAANKLVYFYYTSTSGATHNRVSRFTVVDDDPVDFHLAGTSTAPTDAGSTGTPTETLVFALSALGPSPNHNGGAIHFGADDKLFIATGDAVTASNSQSLANTHGKLLRINADGTIPADNPFFGETSDNNRAIWALGLRNPFRFAVQPGTNRIFINDVGGASFEEINDGVAGANYGWPGIEGNTGTPPAGPGTYHAPLYTYGHGSGPFTGFVITGGAFYSSAGQPFPAEYANDYFFADPGSGWINVIDTSTLEVRNFAFDIIGAVDLKVSPDGSLYYLARGNGEIFRIQYTTGQNLVAIAPSFTDSLAGSLVSAFAGGVPGIAVTGFGATQTGTWQYSINGGATWQSAGQATDSAARLLRASDRVRFLPAANHVGGATLGYRSWDASVGSAGATVDLTGGVGAGTPYGDTLNIARIVEVDVALRGTHLLVTGTSGEDHFHITAGASPQVLVNGNRYTFPVGVQSLALDGQGGQDFAAILGTSASDAATLSPGAGTLVGASGHVTWNNVETAYVYGQGGADTASFHDSPGNETFGARPEYAYLLGVGFSNWAVGFPTVYAQASFGGADTAFLFDSPGNDTFQARPEYGYLVGAGFIDWAVGFDAVYAYASSGTDTAYLFDSPTGDIFGANPSYAYLQGPGFINWAVGFDNVAAYAGTGIGDVAYLFDSPGNDTFGARPEYAYLQGGGSITWAVGFANVHAYATAGGVDTAYLFDSEGNDTFNGTGATGELILGSTRTVAAQGFDLVSIFSLRGGLDRRNLGTVDYLFEQLGPWL